MADTEFLSFLVDETLRLQTNGAEDLSSLELKLKDYGLEYIKGSFVPQTQMLHFSTSFGVLDIPVNWSVFEAASNTVFSENDDNELLLSVMKNAWNPKFQQLLITHADGFCYIVGLKTGEDSRIRDIFNPQVILKAA